MFRIEFDTDNAAFADDMLTEECARILRAVADRIEGEHRTYGRVSDINGNKVGEWAVSWGER